MTWLLDALGWPDDKEHRRRLDAALRAELELPEGAHCPEVWAAVKARSADERAGLPGRLRL